MGRKKHHQQPIEKEPVLNVKFSFQYYDTQGDKYCLSKAERSQILEILKRLKEVSEKTFHELIQQSYVYHFHEVNWSKTTERNGFPYEAVNQLPPFQIALLAVNGQKARMYGGFSQDTFYVVWIDLEHSITPSYKKNT